MKSIKDWLRKFFKENQLYFYAFFIGIIIISVVFKLNNVAPFGGNSLLCVDFYHQYGPMLAELYDRIHQGENLIYSFNMAMGLPFFRNFLNYLSSPFNIIMFLFNHKNLIMSYSVIIGLKAVMADTTMVYYLSKKFKTKKLYLLPLGIIYAFSAYFQAYYWNIMWLDGMVFVPLITLGIEYIVNEHKWRFYTFYLAIMLIANYFIGYMICLYAVVYFLLYLVYKTKFHLKTWKKDLTIFIKKGLMFGFASLMAGCLTAFLLLPMFKALASISATGGEIPTSQYYDFLPIDYIKAHLTGVSTTVFASDAITKPNISCGILSVALLLAYLINIDIPFKNKICYLLLLGFFIFAFFNPVLDYIFHAFHVPNDLPYRYSFLYSFVLVLIGAYALMNIKKIKFPLIVIGYLLIMALLIIVSMEEWAGITQNMAYINMILLTLYFIFYAGLYFTGRLQTLFYIALTVVACIDVGVSINYNWNITQVLSVFYEDYDETKELLADVKAYDDELFYRIENTNMMTLNDGSWYDYYGQTTFSSMAYENMAILQHNLGIPGNVINSYYYVQSTPIYDLMFDIKYFIGMRNDYNRYKEIVTNMETANEFEYNVGLMFGTNKDLLEWTGQSDNPFANQNQFMRLSSGVDEILTPATLINTEELYQDDTVTILKYEYENTFDNFYYYSDDFAIDFMIVGDTLYYNNDNYQTLTSYSDELNYTYIEDYDEEKIINILSSEENITLYVAYNVYYSGAFDLYTIDHDRFVEAYTRLDNNKVHMTSFSENKMKGNISLDDDMLIYTSIPYDEGWQVYIDGKRVETESLADALLVFECPKGTHEIFLIYHAPLMLTGTIITSLTGIPFFLTYLYPETWAKYEKKGLDFLKRKMSKRRLAR